MFAESERDVPRGKKRPRVGDAITGKVISIGKDTVFVDLGGKAEGSLERTQVSDPEDKLLVKVGDTIEARVVADTGGALTLRMKVGRGPEARAELQQAFELGMPVEGTVTEVVKGGVSVDVAGVRGFVPASQLDVRFIDDLATYIGQRLTFRITRYEPRNLVLSRRVLLEEENA
ncbi:MAG: S1 RNA-binding domain-containing protein, partial [Solirubrobacteraceae bacterium]